MTGRIGRRAFTCRLAALVASLAGFCLPGASDAQQPALPRHVGVILVGFSPESKEAQAFPQGLRDAGYVIGSTESPIVPIFIGEEARAIALWRELLAEGLYVNLIVPPGCPQDECVLRASCSAAHTTEQLTRALDVFARVGAGRGVTV